MDDAMYYDAMELAHNSGLGYSALSYENQHPFADLERAKVREDIPDSFNDELPNIPYGNSYHDDLPSLDGLLNDTELPPLYGPHLPPAYYDQPTY